MLFVLPLRWICAEKNTLRKELRVQRKRAIGQTIIVLPTKTWSLYDGKYTARVAWNGVEVQVIHSAIYT
jgi:hypothetical protein